MVVIAVSDEDAYDDHDDDDKDDDDEEKDEEDECGFCQSLDLDVGFTKLDKANGCRRTQHSMHLVSRDLHLHYPHPHCIHRIHLCQRMPANSTLNALHDLHPHQSHHYSSSPSSRHHNLLSKD